MKRIWLVKVIQNGFVYKVFIRTNEDKLHDYLKTELPYCVSYTAASEKEVEAALLFRVTDLLLLNNKAVLSGYTGRKVSDANLYDPG